MISIKFAFQRYIKLQLLRTLIFFPMGPSAILNFSLSFKLPKGAKVALIWNRQLGPLRTYWYKKIPCVPKNNVFSLAPGLFRHMKIRVSEHQGVSQRTGKLLKGNLSTYVRDHMLKCEHKVDWVDFKILGKEYNHFLLDTKESLFIKRDTPSLNMNLYSQELFLF